ncbi:MAG: rhomboid family intramembrane serine protease [Deltaproteobacteria bacterium]|nr:rhomboid family intramembrane serine protease [Deltaproteobacteria bacterium]
MPSSVETCPKCGALVVPQLVRCRQCNTYLHGVGLEAKIFELIPLESVAHSPGTALIGFGIIVYYVFMLAMTVPTSPHSLLGFSSFSLRQLGATHGMALLLGEYWRFFTSVFAHHDLAHVAFNFWSLTAAGPIVEHVFDKKKMVLMYLVSGVASMIVSFGWYVFVLDQVTFVSAGASGAVSGMIGAALFGARRMGPQGVEIVRGMTRWAIYMVIWGLMMPAINNAAHLGGFAVGAAIAHFSPLGLTKSVSANRGLSVLTLGVIASFFVAAALMVMHLRGFPAALRDDLEPRGILGFRFYQGAAWANSDQVAVYGQCSRSLRTGDRTETGLRACELNFRVNPSRPYSTALLAEMHRLRGESAKAAELLSVMSRMPGVGSEIRTTGETKGETKDRADDRTETSTAAERGE